MKRASLVLVALLVAGPAYAQSRVYTNADLGKPLSPDRPTVTTEELRALVEYQFTLPPVYDGPTVFIVPYDRTRDVLPPMAPVEGLARDGWLMPYGVWGSGWRTRAFAPFGFSTPRSFHRRADESRQAPPPSPVTPRVTSAPPTRGAPASAMRPARPSSR